MTKAEGMFRYIDNCVWEIYFIDRYGEEKEAIMYATTDFEEIEKTIKSLMEDYGDHLYKMCQEFRDETGEDKAILVFGRNFIKKQLTLDIAVLENVIYYINASARIICERDDIMITTEDLLSAVFGDCEDVKEI